MRLILLLLCLALVSCKNDPPVDPTKYYDVDLSVRCEQYPLLLISEFDQKRTYDTIRYHLDTTFLHVKGGQKVLAIASRTSINGQDDSSLITMRISYDHLNYRETPIPTAKIYQVELPLPE